MNWSETSKTRSIWAATGDFQHCGMFDQQSLRSACAYAQSDQSLCQSLEYSMSAKLLTEHHLEFLSLKGGCTGKSESTLVKCHIVGNHMLRLIYDKKLWCLKVQGSYYIQLISGYL